MLGIGDSAQFVVIEDYAVDSAVVRERSGLGLDLLSSKNATNRRQVVVPVEKFQVSSELFNAVDVASAFDLDRYRRSAGVVGEDVDWPHGSHVFAANQSITLAEGLDVGSEQPLKICFHTVFDEARVDTELVSVIAVDFVDVDHQEVSCFVVNHFPHLNYALGAHVIIGLDDFERAGRGHPVEGLITAAIGVNENTAIGLHHHHSGGQGKVSIEATRVVD